MRLLQSPSSLVDRVVVHESAHLLEGGPAPEFRRTLGRALPDREKRKEEPGRKRPGML